MTTASTVDIPVVSASLESSLSSILIKLPPGRMDYLLGLVARGGPEPREYGDLTGWIDGLARDVAEGKLDGAAVSNAWRMLTAKHFRGTMQSLVVETPHGYHGDFEFIDGVYCRRLSTEEHLVRWDGYLQAHAAPRAVRNRKRYFHALLDSRRRGDHPMNVLNVASGPARDVLEWLDANGSEGVRFDCVDIDGKAIRYAQTLCSDYPEAVEFHQANALAFRTSRRYGLVWSAGLFDYLDDGLFVRLLSRLMRFVQSGGEVVVGNFGEHNPTRNYMELLGGWRLIHRSRERLRSLALEAGAEPHRVTVGAEPEGVNLFLHIRIPESTR